MESGYLTKKRIVNKHTKVATIELASAVLYSGCAVTLGLTSSLIIYILLFLNALVLTTILVKNSGKVKIREDGWTISIFLVLLFALLSTVINIQYASYVVTVRCLLSITLAILLSFSFETGRDAIYAFVNVMYFFAIVGIVGWFLFTVIGIPVSAFPRIVSSSNSMVRYNTILIYSQMSGTTRNNGPFWEPSIFAGFLSIALICSKFLLRENERRRLIFLFAIITTQSSGGIILLMLYVLCCMWEQNDNNTINKLAFKIIAVFCVIMVLVFWNRISQILLAINHDVFSKIFNALENGSSLTRLQSFRVDMNIWLSSPIFGVGVDKMEIMFLRLRDTLATITNMSHTSTSTEYLAAFGIGGFWINYLWAKALLNKEGTIIWKILVFLSFFLILNETPQISFVWTYFILFNLLRINNAKEYGMSETY